MILNIEVALVVHCQILRTVVHNSHVCIPLDVVYLGIVAHQVVHNAEHEVLHLGIRQVEHHLRTATTQNRLALGCLDNPFGMFFVEFTGRVGHFRFNPDAELHAVLLGIAEKALDAVGELILVNHPVAQTRIVHFSRVFVAKPSIIHHKQLAAHRRNVLHHLVHTLLVDVEVDAFPRVEQDFALLIAMHELILATPLVEVTADTRKSLV